MRISDLKQKEVINICDCKRLGYVGDVDFDMDTGCDITCAATAPRLPYYNCRQQNTCDQLSAPCKLKLQCTSSNLLQLCYLTITYSNKNQRLFQEKCAKKFHFYLIFYVFLIFFGLNLLEIIFHIIRNK